MLSSILKKKRISAEEETIGFCFSVTSRYKNYFRLVRLSRGDTVVFTLAKNDLSWATFRNENWLWYVYTLLEMMQCHSAQSVEDALKNRDDKWRDDKMRFYFGDCI